MIIDEEKARTVYAVVSVEVLTEQSTDVLKGQIEEALNKDFNFVAYKSKIEDIKITVIDAQLPESVFG